MKRSVFLLVILLMMLSCFLPALAADTATSLQTQAVVAGDGSCRITLQLQLQLEHTVQGLTLPLPDNAKDILVDGTPAQTRTEGRKFVAVLPEMSAGNRDLTVEYTLDHVVDRKTGMLTLPLLSGFALPIRHLEFTLTLPHEITETPQFTSGYHQQQIQQQILCATDGSTLQGIVQIPLKDHETLLLQLQVPAHQYAASQESFGRIHTWDLAIGGCIFLACLYFLLTLLPRAARIRHCYTPPEGISAGEVGTCLTGCGTDLTLLVMSWAQLGYLSIELDARGRALLHKRMPMGNERSSIENRWFQLLFGNKTTIDGTGLHYAQLCRKLATKAPILHLMFARRSGNRWIFRGLCCLAALLSGVRMGLSSSAGTGGRVVLSLVLAVGLTLLSYWIQSGGKCLPLRDKTPLWTALGSIALWILLGILIGRTGTVLWMVLFQFLAGMCAAYGGKRSELGKRSMAQLLGLRKHMVGAKSFDLQQLMQKNPNYFYELAPYALAMGVDRKFARHFGKNPLPEESYLELGQHRPMTAAQWSAQLRRAADILNKRQKRLPLERLFGKS